MNKAGLIEAKGNEFSGADYEFIDADVQSGATYFYKLEDIDIFGESSFHGPIEITLEEQPLIGCGVIRESSFSLGIWVLAMIVALLWLGRPAKKQK